VVNRLHTTNEEEELGLSITSLITILIGGICAGGIYGIISCAFSFQYGALNIVNFAYGAFATIGMFLVYMGIRDLGLNPALVIITLIVLYFFVGFFVRKVFLRSSDGNVQVLITMGISLFLQNFALFVWGATPRVMINVVSPTWKIPVGDRVIMISQWNVGLLALSAVILIGFSVFLKKTWLGMAIRAVVQQKEAANLVGINSERTINVAFGISYVLLSIASVMLAVLFTLETTTGDYYRILAFLISLIAGMGNIKGAFFAGILFGSVSSAINLFLPRYHNAIIYVLFIIVLMFFPNGLFTSKKSLARSV